MLLTAKSIKKQNKQKKKLLGTYEDTYTTVECMYNLSDRVF